MNKAFNIIASASDLRVDPWMAVSATQTDGAQLFTLSKRFFDVMLASAFIVCFLPFYLLLAMITLFTSQGPAIYKQERVGKNGRRFIMYKFRSMGLEAEKKGPQLSTPDDPRITKWGRFMRRYKLDETPQFLNVLEGSMSIVGPRPERAYFRDQLKQHFPGYDDLNQIKPGITSVGQIKFGYASNLQQMLKRSQFDSWYLQNLSIWTDLKIIFMTIPVVLRGEGQ